MIADCNTIPRVDESSNEMTHYAFFTSTYEVMQSEDFENKSPGKFGRDAEGWKRKRSKKNP